MPAVFTLCIKMSKNAVFATHQASRYAVTSL